MDFKTVVDEKIEQILNMSALRPEADLGVQPAASHRASVNRIVNDTDNGAGQRRSEDCPNPSATPLAAALVAGSFVLGARRLR